MRHFLLLAILLSTTLFGCYNPELGDEPFVCGGTHGAGECPEGYGCYGGICLESAPACWTSTFGLIPGNADFDYEPNNTPDLAFMVQCGDIPGNNQACPTRWDTERTYRNLAICGEGDIDIFKIYLDQGETFDVTMWYDYVAGGDLNMVLFHQESDGGYNLSDPDEISLSTNNDEEITHSVTLSGWYYLMIFGATVSDVNGYALQWTILAPPNTTK